MAIESEYKSVVNVRLNAGVKQSSGGMVVKTVSLGNVIAGADKDKVMAVVAKLLPVLAHGLFRVERQEVTVIDN